MLIAAVIQLVGSRASNAGDRGLIPGRDRLFKVRGLIPGRDRLFKVVKTGSDSYTAKHSATGVSVTGHRR